MWTLEHKPKSLEGYRINKRAIEEIRGNVHNKPILVYGQIGAGKTTIIELIAEELDLGLVEITNDNIIHAVTTSQSASITGKKKLIYVNNPENIKKIKEIGKLLSKTRNPLILETSDPTSRRLSTIKKKCKQINIRKPTSASVAKILEQVCEREDISVDKKLLIKIADNSIGDIRSAIIDLETIAKQRTKILEEDLGILESRDRKEDIYKVLSKILVKKDFNQAVKSTWNLGLQPRDTIMWIDENIPRVYGELEDLYRAFQYLARADRYMGRIHERQYWGFLRYATPLMTGGVNAARKGRIKHSYFQFPRYIIEMSKTKKERGLKKSIGEKLSPILHASNRTIAEQYIPLYRTLLKQGITSPEGLLREYRLDSEEIDYLQD
ncbi:MAG: AAA family ATPase [Candidatus Altiarchaeota archaeon]|nr:AAA family ATPase [Candidatus Altiarchaeota archaeon]